MSTIPKEPSLRELIDAGKSEADQPVADSVVSPLPTSPEAEASPEAIVPLVDVSGASDTGGDGDGQAEAETPEEPTSWLREFLSSKIGIEVDGVPDDELESFVEGKIKRKDTNAGGKDGSAEHSPRQDVSESAAQQSPAPAKESDAPAAAAGRKVGKLEYDRALAEYVTFDDKGNATPNPEFGAQGEKAAEQLNSYTTARRKRAEEFIDDPVSYLQDDLRAEFQKMLDEQLTQRDQTYRSERETEAQNYARAVAEQQESQAVQQLLDINKSKLYVVGKDGEPKRLLDSENPVFTQYGRDVDLEFIALQKINPAARHSVLITEAIRIADRYHAKDAAKAAPAAVDARKREFLDQGKKHSPAVSADKPPASLAEKIASKGHMKLSDMIKEDEDNEGNPVLSRL
jgi:hypothetical protein